MAEIITSPILPEATQAATALRKTALNATHRQHKASMVDFGGWDMPVTYAGLIAEHMAVRTGVGLFDVSHMGDIQFRGPGSLAAVNQLCMNDASKLQVGQAHYSAMLYPNGTFVDDVVVHKLSDNDYLIVINAGTREKDVQWVRQQIGHMGGVHVNDFSATTTPNSPSRVPKAEATLQKLTDDRPFQRHPELLVHLGPGCAACYNVMIARTGYTGEDGFEIYIPSDEPTSGHGSGARSSTPAPSSAFIPCGLGAHAIPSASRPRWPSTATKFPTPSTSTRANLGRLCQARQALLRRSRRSRSDPGRAAAPGRSLVGLEMVERGIGRDGYPVLSLSGEPIGDHYQRLPGPFPQEKYRSSPTFP